MRYSETGTPAALARRLAGFVALFCCALHSAGAQTAAPPPKISVSFERIDPSNFPDVDVYFRVVDTVPSSAYHPPVRADVKVFESPEGGGGFQATPIASDNFAKPDIRPLAIALAVDRSNSVKPILTKIQEATIRWLQGMSDNGALADDAVSMELFAGSNNLGKLLRLPLTTDRAATVAFAQENLTRTAGGTPLHKAWNVSVRDVAMTDYPARAVLMLTDGKNAPRNGGPKVDSIIQAAFSNGIPMFNFAFVKVKGAGKLARNSVYRPDMIRMADKTAGAYFEPIPPFPLLPDLPVEPDDPASAASLPDDEAIAYEKEALGLVKNLLTDDPDAKFEDFAPVINRLVEPDVATLADFNALDLTSDATFTAGVAGLTYMDLAAFDAALEAGSKQTVSEEDLRTFYVDQVENMFTKVRTSLKTLYRVTYRSPDPRFGGVPRDVRVDVAYTTAVNSLPLALAGKATGRYITPRLVEEDLAREITTSLNPSSPVHDLLFGAAPAPRDGAWKGATGFDYTVDLMGPGEDGRPAVLATRTPAGAVTVSDDAASPAASLTAAERTALSTYLTHLEFEAIADPSAGTLRVRLRARIPTCVRDVQNLDQRPKENPSGVGLRKLLWYRVLPRAVRRYDYTLTVPTAEGNPGDEVASVGEVAEELPMLVAFIVDTTVPTLALYLTPRRDASLERLSAVELPVDTDQRPRPFTALLTGKNWSGGLNTAFSESPSPAVTAFPLTVSGAEVKGFYVNEDVRITTELLARDNSDRNDDASYLASPGTSASHNLYRDADPALPAAREGQAPYLARLTPEEFAAGKTGATLVVDEDGVQSAAGDSIILRAPNVPDGKPVALEARARDESGNVSVMRVPVFVLPLGIDFRAVDYESQRGDGTK